MIGLVKADSTKNIKLEVTPVPWHGLKRVRRRPSDDEFGDAK